MARKKVDNNEKENDVAHDDYDDTDAGPAADHDDLSNSSWDDVAPPMPLPSVRFKWQGLAATYTKPDGDGTDHKYAFCFMPLMPVTDIDESELPEDWQSQRVWVRFDVPGRPSFPQTHFDVKNFFKLVGIDTTGMTRAQANAEFKKVKPVIEATVKRRTWTDKATNAQRWAIDLRKIALADAEGFEDAEAA